jgi:phosphohistidine swiveling domain-containing protein
MPTLDAALFSTSRPGQWNADGLHGPRPYTLIGMRTFGDPIEAGSRASAVRYGLPHDGLAVEFMQRFEYVQQRPLVRRPAGEDEPSRAAFEALVAADVTLQDRLRAAEETLATRRWEGDLEQWDSVGRPWLMGRTLALTDIEPAALDVAGLEELLRATVEQDEVAMRIHHVLNPLNAIPAQRFYGFSVPLTGVPFPEHLPLMQGASPVSIGDEPELRAVAEAVRAAGVAESLLDSGGDPADQVERLRTHEGAVGETMRAFLRLAGYRSIGGWEPMEPFALEEPMGLIATIRAAIEGKRPQVDPELVASIRDRVPDDQREEWDARYADARRFARIRDERDVYCNIPASGLIRRVTLEVGRRLHAAGRIDDVEHATEGSVEELASLLRGESGVSSQELAERHAYRHNYTIKDIPMTVGEPLAPPVSWKWLPQAWQALSPPPEMAGSPRDSVQTEESSSTVVTGTTAQQGTYEGPARIVTGPNEFAKIQRGDVLVTPATNPAFSIILPLLGAIVTDHGNPLSHAAIIAREFGLPAVVGCNDATELLHDGDLVRVDADAGRVEVLSSAER